MNFSKHSGRSKAICTQTRRKEKIEIFTFLFYKASITFVTKSDKGIVGKELQTNQTHEHRSKILKHCISKPCKINPA